MLPEFVIFNISISMYPFCVATGFLVGMIIADLLSSFFSITKKDSYILMCVVEAGVIIGGKLLYLLINIKHLFSYYQHFGFWGIFTKTGFVFYGGLFCSLLFIYFFSNIKHYNFKDCVALVSTVTPLIHSFGRIGCFCAGCCYGIEWKGSCSLLINGKSLFPVQLLESGLNLLFFVIILLFVFNKKQSVILYLYFIGYGIIRFICELFRGDIQRGFIGHFSISSYISIFCILSGAISFYLNERKSKNNE